MLAFQLIPVFFWINWQQLLAQRNVLTFEHFESWSKPLEFFINQEEFLLPKYVGLFLFSPQDVPDLIFILIFVFIFILKLIIIGESDDIWSFLLVDCIIMVSFLTKLRWRNQTIL